MATKPARTPKAHKLPQVPFETVMPLARAMVDLNGPSSRNLIFEQAGWSGTGGTSKTRWAALNYYGLRETLGPDKHGPTERARAMVSGDPGVEREAKQQALVGTGARALIKRFSSRPVNLTVIAGILRSEYDVPTAKSEASATLLVNLATDAGFVVDGVFKASVIEPALDAVPEAPIQRNGNPSPVAERVAAKPKPALETRPKPSAENDPPPVHEAAAEEDQAGPFGVALEIRIEAQHHTPKQIGEIVRQIRAALSDAA